MNQTLPYEDSRRNCQLRERRLRSNAVAGDQVGHTATRTQNQATPIALYPRHAHCLHMRASSGLPEELPKKLGRTEVFVSSNWQPWCPSAGTISNIDVGSYRGCRRHPNCAYPRASGPGALADGPINRSIEEERRVQVL